MGAMWVQIKTHKTIAKYFKSSLSAVNQLVKCRSIKATPNVYIKHLKTKKDNSNNLDILMLPHSRDYKRLRQLGK